jgi:CDP-glucose 4,6-dehydratase
MIHATGPQPKEMPALALSSAQAERSLGWRSRLDANEAVRWTAEWYRAFADGGDARHITRDQIKRYASI